MPVAPNETDFYLASTDNVDFDEPRRCRVVKRVQIDEADDCMLVEIDPVVVGQSYGLGGEDIDTLVLAARHEGCSLFPVTEWPLYVNVARPLVETPNTRDVFKPTEIELIAWGAIYETEQGARKKE